MSRAFLMLAAFFFIVAAVVASGTYFLGFHPVVLAFIGFACWAVSGAVDR